MLFCSNKVLSIMAPMAEMHYEKEINLKQIITSKHIIAIARTAFVQMYFLLWDV